jgi:rhodanese-related sulfurtransferase
VPPRVKFLLDNWYWIVTALVSGGVLLWPMLTRGGSNAISPQEAVQMMNREKAVVIDVCEAAEFAAGHVVNARNIPLATLDGAKGLPSNKQLPLVLVCARGTRAAKAAGVLTKAGHQRVHVLGGGMAAWREAGLPVEKSA